MIDYILNHLQHDICLWIFILGMGFVLGAVCSGAILWYLTKDK